MEERPSRRKEVPNVAMETEGGGRNVSLPPFFSRRERKEKIYVISQLKIEEKFFWRQGGEDLEIDMPSL